MSRKTWLLSGLIIVAVSLLTPGPYEKMENAYHSGLWTYDYYNVPASKKHWYSRRYFTIQNVDHGNVGTEPWNRFRFGFPFRGVTVDSNVERFLVQGKIEVDFLLLNIILNGLIFLFGYGVFEMYKKIRLRCGGS